MTKAIASTAKFVKKTDPLAAKLFGNVDPGMRELSRQENLGRERAQEEQDVAAAATAGAKADAFKNSQMALRSQSASQRYAAGVASLVDSDDTLGRTKKAARRGASRTLLG